MDGLLPANPGAAAFDFPYVGVSVEQTLTMEVKTVEKQAFIDVSMHHYQGL